jgi:hypothetical protein
MDMDFLKGDEDLPKMVYERRSKRKNSIPGRIIMNADGKKIFSDVTVCRLVLFVHMVMVTHQDQVQFLIPRLPPGLPLHSKLNFVLSWQDIANNTNLPVAVKGCSQDK